MRPFPLGAAVLLLAGGLVAQQPAASTAKDECAKLTAEVKAAAKEFQQRVKEVQATDEYKKARQDRDSDALRNLMASVTPVDLAGFTARFQEAAKRHAGTKDEAMFLAWIAQNSPNREAVHDAVDALVAEHIDSADFETFLASAGGAMRHYDRGAALDLLANIAERSKKNVVRAQAMYLQATLLKRGRGVSDDDKAKADKLLAEAGKLAEGTPLADTINAPLFEQEHLQIGMAVPDIVGEDIDGVPFKLSDYRGKVVVLDFWGDW